MAAVAPYITIRRHRFNSAEGSTLAADLDAELIARYPDIIQPGWRGEPVPDDSCTTPGRSPHATASSTSNHGANEDDIIFFVAFSSNQEDGTNGAVDEQAIGCIALLPQLPDPRGLASVQGTGEVRKMYIDPLYRGRGVAKKLLNAVETAAREELRLERLVLSTGNRQPEAVDMYTRSGWKRRGIYGEGFGFSEARRAVSLFWEKRLK